MEHRKATFIIAEAGVNHNGDLRLALQLCDAAKKANADAVKFQTFRTESNITHWAGLADYQKDNLQQSIGQFEMVQDLELEADDFKNIKAHCDNIGIEFLSTPDDPESLGVLLALGVRLIKVSSGEITNLPLLREIGRARKPVILSTGMSSLSEVSDAYDILLRNGSPSVSLLHCTSAYPCPPEEVNLRAMVSLREKFHTDVGYSDHTLGIEVPIAAAALGADIIEKHLTLDRKMVGPDHAASLVLEEFQAMVLAIRKIEKALGDGTKKPSRSELEMMKVSRRSIVAAGGISKGERFTEINLAAKRPGTGISPVHWDSVVGKISKREFKKDELIEI